MRTPLPGYINDLGATLQHEIDLPGFIRIIAGRDFLLTLKLLQYMVLRQRTLEWVVSLQENGAVVNAGHVLEQTRVEEEQLEAVESVEGGKQVLGLCDIVYPQ